MRKNHKKRIEKAREISMSTLNKGFTFMLLLLISSTLTFANNSQGTIDQNKVNGIVKDKAGSPLPGVTVIVQGTSKAVASDFDGNYSITASKGDVLQFSYIGMITKSVTVGDSNTINVVLEEDSNLLEEVIVVGYGTQKKINVTGAVSSVKISEELGDRPVANVSSMLQGVLPGLTVTNSNSGGEPGAGLNINIRGAGTLTGNGGKPYILVDGIPYGERDLNALNPDDIEDVTVLKDAASAAIYGSKGAYGVILINTKKGKLGAKAKVEYSSNWAFSSPTMLPKIADSYTFALMVNQAQTNSGQTPWFTPDQLQKITDYQNGLIEHEAADANEDGNWDGGKLGYANNDWYDIFFAEDVPRVKHDLSVRGGGEKTTYYLSGSFFEQDGALKFGADKYERFNFAVNVSTKANDWLTLKTIARYAKEVEDFPSGGFGGYTRSIMYHQMSRVHPTSALYDPEGNLIDANALRMSKAGREITDKHNSFFNFSAVLEPVENWVTTLSYNKNIKSTFMDREEFNAEFTQADGDIVNRGYSPEEMEKSGRLDERDLFNIVSSYKKSINEKHNISVMAGYEQRLDQFQKVGGRRKQLLTQEVPTISTSIGDQFVYDAEGHFASQGIFGRIKYNYKEKYLVEFNGRYDGSSYFSEGNKWGFFPSVSGSYVISKEDFFNSNIVNTLKLRASWGELGNHDPKLASRYTPLMKNDTSPWLEGGNQLVYINAPDIISPTLTWETVTTTNFGIDAAFFNNRLNSTAEIYKRVTSDMIGPSSVVPNMLGTSAPRVNNGELTVNGWELSLSWRDNIGKDFSYGVGFNISDNTARITAYNNPDKLLRTYDDWQNKWVTRYTDYKLGDIWAYTSVGLYQTDEEAAAGPDQSKFRNRWLAGDMEYADLNGDGRIDDGSNTFDDHGDKSIVGNNRARYNYGINMNASYKGFDMSILFQGVGKRDYIFDSNTNLYYGFRGNFWQGSYTAASTDYWTPENPDAFFPKPYNTGEHKKNTQNQTHFMEDASYIRLKNLQIGYTLPSELLEKTGLFSSVRFHVSGENLWTKTDLNENFDPETLGGGWGGGKIYPPSKVLSVGMNISF